MTDLTELLARVEAAEGPDRELDVRIAWTLNGATYTDDEVAASARVRTNDDCEEYRICDEWSPAVTASLDAALALVERVLPGWTWDIGCDADMSGRFYTAILWTPDVKNDTGECQSVASPALALLAALLKALIAQQEGV